MEAEYEKVLKLAEQMLGNKRELINGNLRNALHFASDLCYGVNRKLSAVAIAAIIASWVYSHPQDRAVVSDW